MTDDREQRLHENDMVLDSTLDATGNHWQVSLRGPEKNEGGCTSALRLT
jgi:hypothetical protein